MIETGIQNGDRWQGSDAGNPKKTYPSLARIRAKIRAEREDYLKRLEEAQVQISVSGIQAVKKILELCIDAKSKWKNASNEKRAEYAKVVYSNPILEAGNLRYDYQKPFKVISEMRGNPVWWTKVPSYRTFFLHNSE